MKKLVKISLFILCFAVIFSFTACGVSPVNDDDPNDPGNDNTTYTLTFNSNGGGIVASIRSKSGQAIAAPNAPTKTDYVFGGWYEDEGLSTAFTFGTMPAANKTLYAKWLKKVGLRTNPAPLDQYVACAVDNFLYNYGVEIKLEEVIRGAEANTIVEEANQYNADPASGKEYLLAKFKMRGLASEDDAAISIADYDFDAYSGSFVKYAFTLISGLKPGMTDLYEGGEYEAWTGFLINSDDANPYIVFNNIWFSTDPGYEPAAGSFVYAPAASLPALYDAAAAENTHKNPIDYGLTGTYDGTGGLLYTYKVELTVVQVDRGAAANQAVAAANMFNGVPPEGYEYILIKFSVEGIESDDDEEIDISSLNFDLISEDGYKYDLFIVVSGLEPEFTEFYSGATIEGYAYFLVKTDDQRPIVVFNGKTWFDVSAR
jgi:Listeria/Bacterioides repeat